MKKVEPVCGLESEIASFIASLSPEPSFTPDELIRSLCEDTSCGKPIAIVSTFLDTAPAVLILRILLASGTGDEEVCDLIASVVALAKRLRCERAATLDIELRRARVPCDFPVQPGSGAGVAAVSTPVSLRYGRETYCVGTSPPEVLERWVLCEALAQQLATKIRTCKAEQNRQHTHSELLLLYEGWLLRTGWGTAEQMKWVVSRAAKLLGGNS